MQPGTDPLSLDTRLVHDGEPEPRVDGSVVLPVFQSAMYEYRGEEDELRYIRYGNTPNHRAVARLVASAEGTEDGAVTASGMAAISGSVLAVLRRGDRLLAQEALYGGTHDLFTNVLPSLGIEVDMVDGRDPDSWRDALRPATRALYVESLSNPLLEVARLEEAADFARRQGLVSMVDNTFATPVNFRPCSLGFDLSIHSATKYLNGHSDVVAGAVAGPPELVERVRRRTLQMGGSLDPHACALLHRGLKTLGIRVERQNGSAERLARSLEEHPSVRRVHYPGLESHPDHDRASRLFSGFGGMLSFEVEGGGREARRFLDAVEIPVVAPSLGGVESLVTRPAATSHASVPRADREAMGITDGLVRVSVGIESPDDLVEDFRRALDRPAA